MTSKFSDIPKIPELRRRLIFTLAMLAIYRVGVFITVPGVDRTSMSEIFAAEGGGVMGMLNLFTGGALELMSIFALGIMPYISAAIIFQLMTVVVPTIERLKKEGQSGQKKITQWTRY
ncbi:MAG: preprotein translocase subunit SecY, partial [Bradymonadaceae bacterium]